MFYRIRKETDEDGSVTRHYMADIYRELELYAGTSDGGRVLPPQWPGVPGLTSQEWTLLSSILAAGVTSVMMLI